MSDASKSPRGCAHPGCTCELRDGRTAGGARYCSNGCAAGEGCDHEACGCRAAETPGVETPMRGD